MAQGYLARVLGAPAVSAASSHPYLCEVTCPCSRSALLQGSCNLGSCCREGNSSAERKACEKPPGWLAWSCTSTPALGQAWSHVSPSWDLPGHCRLAWRSPDCSWFRSAPLVQVGEVPALPALLSAWVSASPCLGPATPAAP